MNKQPGHIAGYMFRLYACGMTIVFWLVSSYEPQAIAGQIALSHQGRFVLWLMLVFGAFGVLDMLINDLMGAIGRRPLFVSTRAYRHFGFTLLAFCHALLVYLAIVKACSPGLALFSLWNAVFIVGFSLYDAFQRSLDGSVAKE